MAQLDKLKYGMEMVQSNIICILMLFIFKLYCTSVRSCAVPVSIFLFSGKTRSSPALFVQVLLVLPVTDVTFLGDSAGSGASELPFIFLFR